MRLSNNFIYRIAFLYILLSFFSISAFSQDLKLTKEKKSVYDYSNPDRLENPPNNSPGFPSRDPNLDVKPGFENPPPGYGQVPFWWWSGDTLTNERLLWQIEELHRAGISGMQINYIHKDSPGWPTYPASPEIFSESWWNTWKFAAKECGKRDMGIGLSSYTLDWPKSQNLFNEIIYNDSAIQGREIKVDTIVKITAGTSLTINVKDNLIGFRAYKIKNSCLQTGSIDLKPFVKKGILNWKADNNDYEVWFFSADRIPGTLNPIHPRSGEKVLSKFFQPFQDNALEKSAEGLNYFFQDELQFGVGDYIWSDDLEREFKKRKGYDIFDALPALFQDIGDFTPKARIDFMDVKVRLSEERYFIPIFEWHWKRGKIYGCDPEGRGLEPGKYGDNFQTIRWYSAPGHDTPGGNADLIKGKISSSIAGLYKRPRVWLEGYHSLGWGATPERLMFATNENYLYGCNLLNLHGLYYTTYGSFWEWAPPCYHFRMPYWDHMKVFLKYFERLSYLFSQGILIAEMAIIYPVTPAQARIESEIATNVAFSAGKKLFNSGYDFVFIDDQSVCRSKIANGKLNVSDMSFKVLILPSLKVIKWETLYKILDFYRNGGVVVSIGSLPEASDRKGRNDSELRKILIEIFGKGIYSDASSTGINNNIKGGIGLRVKNADELLENILNFSSKAVLSENGTDKVRSHHRKIGFREAYLVMGASKNSYCSFRSKGIPERWDPWNGRTYAISEFEETEIGTKIKMPLDSAEAQIIVFTPKDKYKFLNQIPDPAIKPDKPVSTLNLEGDWEFELKPTLNNQWGDFRLPITEKIIGAEARIFDYYEDTLSSFIDKITFSDNIRSSRVSYGFGQKFWKLGPFPDDIDTSLLESKLSSLKIIDTAIAVFHNNNPYRWKSYDFSWRFGLEGDPGHQGYHGLKEEISDDFICLGKPTEGLNEKIYVREKEGSIYYLWTAVHSDEDMKVRIEKGGLEPSVIYINGERVINRAEIELRKGINYLLLRYSKAGRGHFVLCKNDEQVKTSRTPLSMKWYDYKNRLEFDPLTSESQLFGYYRFISPPGLRKINIRVVGDIEVRIDNQNEKPDIIEKTHNFDRYEILLEKPKQRKSEVLIKVKFKNGFYGGAAFPEPILLECEKGVSEIGDWSIGSALENYSGGAYYSKSVIIPDIAFSSAIIDLGNVVATAEVFLNDKSIGVIVSSPWELDITEHLKKGENKLKILVYNTLANHYLTIPSKYKGNSLKSGLIGPVKINFFK